MKKYIPDFLTSIKYFYSFVIMVIIYFGFAKERMFVIQLLELVAIVFLSDFLVRKNRLLANLLNATVMFFFNAQLLLMLFSTSYLSPVMLSNITLISDLSGKANVYIPNVVIMIIVSIIPISKIGIIDRIELPKRVIYVMPLVLSLGVSVILGSDKSPYISYLNLGLEIKKSYEHDKEIKALEEKYNNLVNGTGSEKTDGKLPGEDLEFFKYGIASGWDKEVFSEKPNVIFIMTEGLSKSIVDDSRGIMKNVKEYEGKSLHFSNYYDHSIATYRGIIGQLYSGHQFDDKESNKLISITDVLRDEGYKSICINVEPNIQEFVDYLEQLNFDEFVSNPGVYEGRSMSISDKEAYDILKEYIIENSQMDSPYFINMYTFGTHLTLDSPHLLYGDGKDITLNRFYNLDHWFGEFMNWFENAGEITDNTLLVFTADHATFADNDWSPAFPDCPREDVWVDTIPLFFYHKGVNPQEFDVEGRNSINIVPTILDYINLGEDHYNFFLGSSLFVDNEDNPFETVFYSKDYNKIIDTKDGVLRTMDSQEKEVFLSVLKRYFAIKKVGVR